MLTPSGPVVMARAAAMSSANRFALRDPAGMKPSPPALDTAAASAGVPGPPAIGAPTMGTAMSQKPRTIRLIYHRPKLLGQRSFRGIRAQNGGTVALAQQPVGHRVDLLDGHLVDLLQGVLDAAVFAVVQFAAADAAHPGAGILQPEDKASAQRAFGDAAFRLGDAIARHRFEHPPRHSP